MIGFAVSTSLFFIFLFNNFLANRLLVKCYLFKMHQLVNFLLLKRTCKIVVSLIYKYKNLQRTLIFIYIFIEVVFISGGVNENSHFSFVHQEGIWILMKSPAFTIFVFVFVFFTDQCLLHCSYNS